MTNHSTQLIINALFSAAANHSAPEILHSDHGSEYASADYSTICQSLNVRQSMSQPGCPWENGYQESFYSQFKIDLGDSDRFNSLGELVYAIYKTVHLYNHSRIHSKLKMPPVLCGYGRVGLFGHFACFNSECPAKPLGRKHLFVIHK